MCRPLPTAGPPMPDRSNRAGVSRLPAAATTVGALMTTRTLWPVAGSVKVPSTPDATPLSVRIFSTRVFGMITAPASHASCR